MGEYYPNNTVADEDNEQHFRDNADAMIARFNEAIANFFQEGRGPQVTYLPEEPAIQLDAGLIEIRVGIHEQKRIGGPERYVYRPAFDIITYKSESATRWHPEDVWDVELGTKENPMSAVEFALSEWFKLSSGQWFENANTSDWIEEEVEDWP